MIQHKDNAILIRPQVYNFVKFFLGVVWYIPNGIACHHIVAMIDLAHQRVVTTYPAAEISKDI